MILYSRRSHRQEHEPYFGVEGGLQDLVHPDRLVANARLAVLEPLYGDDALLGLEEPCGLWRVGDEEAPYREEKGQNSREDVNVLPAGQLAAVDLGEAVVEGAADDGKPPAAGEPPALTERLLLLRVVPADDGHEGGGDQGLSKA